MRHFETIDDIGREARDALAPGSCFYQSHAWLRGQERPEFATPGHLTVEADGQLLAGTPYYDFPPENAPPVNGLLLRGVKAPEQPRESVLKAIGSGLRHTWSRPFHRITGSAR
ncbi:hypothetical protein ACWCQW_41585 [Streptomyces mirabilis]